MLPLVSVIVPTLNSARTLPQCLKSIKNQTYPQIEVIVVDNFSRDQTLTISKNSGAIALLKGPERSAQLNYGIQRSSGKYLYRLDSDMVAKPEVISEAVRACEKNSVDAVAIRVISDPTISYWSKVRYYERKNFYYHNANIAVRFFSRIAFDSIGGFDENLNGFEDYDFHDRLVRAGFKFGRVNANEIHLGEPSSLAEIVRKHFYYGTDLKKYLSKNRSAKNGSARRLSLVRLGQAQILHELTKEPSIIPGFAIYQFTRYIASAVGALFSKS